MQYFSNSWEESLKTSLVNFLRAIFQNLSPPSLLGISIFKTERQRSQAQIRACTSEIALYREECSRAHELAAVVVRRIVSWIECDSDIEQSERLCNE